MPRRKGAAPRAPARRPSVHMATRDGKLTYCGLMLRPAMRSRNTGRGFLDVLPDNRCARCDMALQGFLRRYERGAEINALRCAEPAELGL